jgi:hypothetical protein
MDTDSYHAIDDIPELVILIRVGVCRCACIGLLGGRVWIYSSLPCMGKLPMVVVTVQGAPVKVIIVSIAAESICKVNGW